MNEVLFAPYRDRFKKSFFKRLLWTAASSCALGGLYGLRFEDHWLRIERHDIQYDKTDYPEPPEPVVVDISAECRREWGVPEPKVSTSDESFEKLKTAAAGLNPPLLISKIQDRRQDKKPAAKYSLKDKTDLDAIGQEE